MNQYPWFSFYPSDWMNDLDEYPLEIEGAWIRIICKMHKADCDGKMTRTLDEWSRILRVSEQDAERIIQYLYEKGICDMSRIGHTEITVMSRRLIREAKIREQNRLRKRKQRCHANVTRQKSESYTDTELEKEKNKEKTPLAESNKKPNAAPLDEIFITLPLIDNSEYQITESVVREMEELYPAVNVKQEFRNMKGWCISHPKNRKTKRGIKTFYTGWISRAQNKAPRIESPNKNTDRWRDVV